MSDSLEKLLAKKATRVDAIIEICTHKKLSIMPDLIVALDKLSWDEVGIVTPHLRKLGTEAVPYLCTLLTSSRKQTIEAVTTALSEIGDPESARHLADMMEAQSGHANAIRARDALIGLGLNATSALINSLDSPKWETRYYATQALAVIGDVDAITPLIEIASEDRSNKVREVAKEALQLIPSVPENRTYIQQKGFYNPSIEAVPILPEWNVDIINGYQPILLWGIQADKLREHSYHGWDDYALRSLLQAYAKIGKHNQLVDVIVYLGVMEEEDELGESHEICVVGVSGIDENSSNPKALMNFLNESTFALQQLPGYINANVAQDIPSDLIPMFHLKNGEVIRYDLDNSYSPESVQQDTSAWFGTSFQFTFSKAVVDGAWLLRENLPFLKEEGIVMHIPIPRDENNVETRTNGH